MQTLDLARFSHQKGNHCGSTSLRDILRYGENEVSEALVFGLASGLGFIYFPEMKLLNGRSMGFEGDFFQLQGRPIEWAGNWDPKAMAQVLALDQPILVLSDIYYLPYYDDTHFPGHSLVVVGIDLDNQTVQVADVIADQLQEIPLSALKAAMEIEFPGMVNPYSWAGIAPFPLRRDRPTLVQAILRVCQRMLKSEFLIEGTKAMRVLAQDLPSWPEGQGWAQAARFAYQTIEKRGTGGGAFRLMYGEFLREAAELVPELRSIRAPERMRQAGESWREVALILKSVSLEQDPSGFGQAAEKVVSIADLEEGLYLDLETILARATS
jgi:hypothetical protein